MSTNALKDFISKNILAISVQVVGVLVVLLNLWLSTRIAPFSERVQSIDSRVAAIELRNKMADPLIERFYKVETINESVSDDIKEIKASVIVLNAKIDRLFEK